MSKKGHKINNEDLEGTIIISNHYSNLDPFIFKKMFLKKDIFFVATKDIKKKLWARIITYPFNVLYVYPEEISRDFIKSAISIIKNKGTILIFPEGFVNPKKYGFLDFMKSYALIAKRSQANVLPVFNLPNGKPFRRNIIHFCKTFKYDDYKHYKDLDRLNIFFQSEIMEASLKY